MVHSGEALDDRERGHCVDVFQREALAVTSFSPIIAVSSTLPNGADRAAREASAHLGCRTPVGTIVFRFSDGAALALIPGASSGIAFLDEHTLAPGEADGTVTIWCLP